MRRLRVNKILAIILFLVTVVAGCEGFWGKKLDPSFIDVPVYNDRTVAYVPIQPVWNNFMHPVDIIVGFDELLYVADDLTEEIICLDQAGNELGRLRVRGVHSIAQDRSLDLLALGLFDTLGTTVHAIYRIELKNPSGYGIRNAVIENKTLHPFYYKATFNPNVDDRVSLNSIAVRGNNDYYVTRSGSNPPSPVFGPDDAVVMFSGQDRFISTVRVTTNAGILSDYFKKPFGITSLAMPPQTPFVPSKGDFVFTSLATATQLKAQYVSLVENENGSDFFVQELVAGDTSKAEGFLYSPGKFAAPYDVTFTGDGTNYIFVVDREKDSLYQFTNTGLEGVKAPAGSSSTKNIRVSFGGTGVGLSQFDEPSGVAYYRQIVYVADAGNRRILRFKLTTDFN